MKTIFASLPFYDSTDKQDVNRTFATQHIHCPTNELPSFLINCESDTIATVDVYLVDCDGTETDITSYLPEDPYEVTVDSDAYLQYDGGVLLTELPQGVYYLRVETSGKSYYSEHLTVSNIYSNLITGWVEAASDNYSPLTVSGTSITSAGASGADYAYVSTNTTPIKKGDIITVNFKLTLNSGAAPDIFISDQVNFTPITNVEATTNGLNSITLTAIGTSVNARIRLVNDTEAANWSTSSVFAYRPYSENFVSLRFSNTNDLGDILYSTTFEQKVWLETRMNHPEHEMVEIGEEKDGVFISEKLVSKFIYKVIAYVSHAMYRVLVRLPQHDSITITDEVGNTYTPSVGNISVAADYPSHETVKVTIRFNDGARSAFSWTYGMDNLI